MWLPTPVYKWIPQFWFLLGMLFVAYGLYVGLDIPTSFGYIAMGFACCIFGVGIAVVRQRHRRDRSEDSDSPAISE